MPLCLQCGYDNAEAARFCNQCGLAFAPNPQPQYPYDQQPQKSSASSFGKFILVMVLLCGGLGVLGSLVFFVRLASIDISGRGTPSPNSGPALPSRPDAHRGVTLANFNQLRDGISYAQAVVILGEPGTELSRTNMGGDVTAKYRWESAGGESANVSAMFKSDKLVSKAQFGLK